MKYCWNCGAQLLTESSKFCPECGTNLSVKLSAAPVEKSQTPAKEAVGADDLGPSRRVSAKELGSTLEDNVAEIFKRMGYNAELRHRFSTQSGTAEIDIILTKGSRKRGVECKNYDPSRNVGIKEVRDFKGRLEQVGIISGLFVTSTQFSGEAEQYADSNGIETWNRSTLQEKLISYFTGRGDFQRLEAIQALPLALQFEGASALNLRNKEAVKLSACVLIYHPYHLVKYRVVGKRKDPTGKTHRINDEGVCIVDALDGDVVNREYGFVGGLGSVFKSKEERVERSEDKAVANDLVTRFAESISPASTSDYQVSILPAQVADGTAWKIARDYAIEKNSRTVHYQPKSTKDDLMSAIDTRSIKIVPKESEVARRGQSIVYAPKWDLQWEAGEMSFQRRVIASSGQVIKDSLSKCAKCSLMHRQTTSVCETCGLPLCEKHSYEETGAIFCADHVSAELKQKIKSNSLMSKMFGRRGK